MCWWIAFECSYALQRNTTRSVALRTELCAVTRNKQPMRIFKCLWLCASEANSSLISTAVQQYIFLKSRKILDLWKHMWPQSQVYGNLSNFFLSPADFWGSVYFQLHSSHLQLSTTEFQESPHNFPLSVPCQGSAWFCLFPIYALQRLSVSC